MLEKISGGYRQKQGNQIKNEPVVSIIIATYNAADHLQDCFNSIFVQPFKNIEILVFDGVSSDNTLEIIKKNEDKIAYWQSQPDDGIYDALNKALPFAKGKWIYFIGSDDVLLSGFSELVQNLSVQNTLYFGYCLRKGLKTNEGATPFRIVKYNVCHQAIFYPSSIFKKYKYNTRYVVYADHALNIEIWSDKSIDKIYLPIAVANYGAFGFSTKTNDQNFRDEKLQFVASKMGWITAIRYLVKKWKIRKRIDKDYF